MAALGEPHEAQKIMRGLAYDLVREAGGVYILVEQGQESSRGQGTNPWKGGAGSVSPLGGTGLDGW